GVGEQTGHLVVLVHLGHTAHAPAEVLVHHGRRIGVEGVQGIGAEQLPDLLVAQPGRGAHSPAPAGSMPCSIKLTRSRPSPERILLLTVPSGWSSRTATSW